jgi:hypothetical protein
VTASSTSTAALWQGPNFSRGVDGLRLLVVAQKDEEAGGIQRVGRTLEAELVENYIDGSMKHRTFTDLARLVLGRAADRSTCGELWNSIAFANLGPEPRLRAHGELTGETNWQGVGGEFDVLVREVKPEAVIVLGDQLWDHLTSEGDGASARDSLPMVHAPHPGRAGFDFREHTAAVRALFQRPGEFVGPGRLFPKPALKRGHQGEPAQDVQRGVLGFSPSPSPRPSPRDPRRN